MIQGDPQGLEIPAALQEGLSVRALSILESVFASTKDFKSPVQGLKCHLCRRVSTGLRQCGWECRELCTTLFMVAAARDRTRVVRAESGEIALLQERERLH